MDNDVVRKVAIGSDKGASLLTLNRPASLNALNADMVRLLTKYLLDGEASDSTRLFLLTKCQESRAFCAGGDVKDLMVARAGQAGLQQALSFIHSEYALDHLIGTLKKPIVSILDGITFGGGAGISIHGSFRIATENTVFAMPETAIGLFPDVLSGFFLSRLDGELGMYLGLTGTRLTGIEVFLAGLATHYIPSKLIPEVITELSQPAVNSFEEVNRVLESFSQEIEFQVWNSWSCGGSVGAAINRNFGFNTFKDIKLALETENSEWSRNTLKLLKQMSPTSLRVSTTYIRLCAKLDFKSCANLDFRIIHGFFSGREFFEGGVAKLIEKRSPNWNPEWENMFSLSDEEIFSKYFDNESSFGITTVHTLNNETFYDYRYKGLSGLPTDRDILDSVTSVNSPDTIVKLVSHWTQKGWSTIPKKGLKGKIESIVTELKSKF